MSQRLGSGQFYLEWDGTRLEALFWRKRTAERVAQGEECGTSFAEALTAAAEFFGISYSTLHRIVRPPEPAARTKPLQSLSAATFYKIRKARHPSGESFRRSLDHVVLGPNVQRVVREYLAYVERELVRYKARRSSKHNIAPLKTKDHGDKPRKEWLTRRDFWIRAARIGTPATRAQLADLRTYDPIVGWTRLRDAFSRKPLTRNEQSRIVRAGYRREERLLRMEKRVLRAAVQAASRRVHNKGS
jgi:hypothetical protein